MESEFTCGNCGSAEVGTTTMIQNFVYGAPDTIPLPVELKATVPLRICKECDFSWFDHVAEEIRDKAVEDYLKVVFL